MGARQSPQMVEAKRLVTQEGLTAYAAAKQAGISAEAIYMSAWYKQFKTTNRDDVHAIWHNPTKN